MLDVQDITVAYSSNAEPTIEGFHLKMKPGEICSIVGESGSGKTTVIRSILGLLPSGGKVTKGDILFEGESLLQYSKKQWRELRGTQISMIFQDSGAMMNPTKKIGSVFTEYILTHEKISKKEAWNKGIMMLERMRLPAADNIMNSYPFQLSGGMRQRVMIAMALACQPQILIADEPTTALDVTIQAQILDLIRGLNEQMNTSVLFITHDLGVVSELCDTVIVMYTGRIVEKAPVRELFNDPKHPYTVGLMSAIPRITKDRPPLETIEGVVPNPTERISGCSFWPRCPHATEQCKQGEPPVVQLSEERQVRCWLYADAAEKKEG